MKVNLEISGVAGRTVYRKLRIGIKRPQMHKGSLFPELL